MLKFAAGLLQLGILIVLSAPHAYAANRAGFSPQDEETAKTIFAELLAIDTTYDKGTVAAVQALRARFLAAGFAETDLVIAANPDHPSQSNLIARLKGTGKGKPLLYLCHLDVGVAKPEDWSVPQF